MNSFDDCDGPLADLSVNSALAHYTDGVVQGVVRACINDEDPLASLTRPRPSSVDSQSLRNDLHELQQSLRRQRTEIETLSRSRSYTALRISSSVYQGSSRSTSTRIGNQALRHKSTSGSLRSLTTVGRKRREIWGFRRKLRGWWYKTPDSL